MLNISSVSKTFFAGTVNERRALRDVDLNLAEGDFVTAPELTPWLAPLWLPSLLAIPLALLGALGRLSKNPVFNGISGFSASFSAGNLSITQSVRELLPVEQVRDDDAAEPVTIAPAKPSRDGSSPPCSTSTTMAESRSIPSGAHSSSLCWRSISAGR